MGKRLIIAEKPSVAQDLSRALGKLPEVGRFNKDKDFFESEHTVIASAIGHLVELCMPNQQTGTRMKWTFEHLPIIPDAFELQPIEDTRSRLNLLIRLMKRKDVDEIVNACDAGREGELIFRYLMEISGVRKPIRRMWMQSMTAQSIVDAYHHLRSDEELQPLAQAARCRSESDWLVGINGTRAMTAFNSKYGGFSKTPVGRVKTPTLAILVEREEAIQSFVARSYWEVHGEFQVRAGQYGGRWFDPAWKKNSEDEHDRAERLWNQSAAEAILARCQGKPATVEEQKKPSKQTPPLLYDLTTLQREAANRFGFSARRTLQLAQSLYERHKVLTYPRTDSRFLPEDYVSEVSGCMRKISQTPGSPGFPSQMDRHAAKALAQGWVRANKRIFDNRKVSDHFAIIPTGQFAKKLDEAELKLYTMVMQRFIAVFFPAAEYEITTRITQIGSDQFKTEGKVLRVAGWREVYGGVAGGDAEKDLVPVEAGERVAVRGLRLEGKETRPPARYTEATILAAMEGAGKFVEDEDFREAMSERGLGTPATRAAILEGLIEDKYVVRADKELVPTSNGRKLIERLTQIGVEILCSPEMTGQWEHRLKRMEQGELDRETFMGEIRALTESVVERARHSAKAAKDADYPDLDEVCPQCGHSPLKQDEGSYRCPAPGCKFSLWKEVASRPLSREEIHSLLESRFVGPLQGFRNRRGEEFTAALVLDEKGKVKFVTEKSEEREREAEQTLREDNVVAKCPLCQSTIHETESAYVCRSNAADSCKARLPREMCQHRFTAEEARAFFEEGKTPLITNFISKRGRPFKAHLVLNRLGKRLVEWEFPPREAKAKKAKAPAQG